MKSTKYCYNTIVIGGGQAGLAAGYYLKRQGQDFVILDANGRIGDAWRKRWDSLRLFTFARYNGLPGMPFPAPAYALPTKDEMADYLEAYATHFDLPVRTGVRVARLSKEGNRFVVEAGDLRFEADNVVVAMANYQCPRVPGFAHEVDPGIVQLHSSEYRDPTQLQAGGILVVGAGNSGAEIALEVAGNHRTWLSGPYPGYSSFRPDGSATQLLTIHLLGLLAHHLFTVRTPIGRKVRPMLLHQTRPLIRVKPEDISAAGIDHVPRTVGVRDGLPMLDDGRVLEVSNIIWCTGYHPGFSWIDLPVFAEDEEPRHERGVVADEPGLYFVGLHFLSSVTSAQVQGIGRDAEHIVRAITSRAG